MARSSRTKSASSATNFLMFWKVCASISSFLSVSKPTDKKMYGDTVIAIWYSVVVPVHGLLNRNTVLVDEKESGASIVWSSLVVAWVLSVLSCWTRRLICARISFVSNIIVIAIASLYGYPFWERFTITEMLIYNSVLGVLANVSLDLSEKIWRLAVHLVTAWYVLRPGHRHEDNKDDQSIFFWVILFEMMILCIFRYGGKYLRRCIAIDNWNEIHLAKMVLTCGFVVQLAQIVRDLRSDDNSASREEKFFELSKTAALLAVGITVARIFFDKFDHVERKARIAQRKSETFMETMVCLTHELRPPIGFTLVEPKPYRPVGRAA